jgi:outer membrane protein OmpA-like peptidoglycan-associated protein
LLALNNQNSRGELDLYVSFCKGNSFNFTTPLNLGKNINTKQNEGSPFLAYDNKTLYFSSNGRKGFGGKDLFMTRRLDDTWTNWSKPVNLGKNINTPKDDNGICLTALGDSAIVTSWDKETMREGMYYICLPDSLQPEPYIVVAGTISGRDIKLTNFNNIDIETGNDKNNKKEHYKPLYANKFYFVIRRNTFVPVIIRKKGFDEFGFAVNSNNLHHSKFVHYSASLSQTKSSNVTIGIVYFDYDEDELNTDAHRQVQIAMGKIIEPSEIQVYVIGHTDEKGNEKYNLELSKKRAESVKKELIKYGLKPGNVILLYKGESEPISQNDDKNRCVEIILIDY